MTDKAFAYELKQIVKLIESGETGTIVGRAQFTNSSDSYYVRYKAADGRQVEAWWNEDALDAA